MPEKSRRSLPWFVQPGLLLPVLCAWLLVGLARAGVRKLLVNPEPEVWYRMLRFELALGLLWFALSLLIVAVIRTTRGWKNLEKTIAWVIAAGLVVALEAAISLAWRGVNFPHAQPMSFFSWLLSRLDDTLFGIVAVAAITLLGMQLGRRSADALRQYQLSTQLSQAQLHVLTLQLQPHFLFNTLNTIAELVHRTDATAARVIGALRMLLARSLNARSAPETTLGSELEFLRAYLQIQEARFGPALEWSIDASPALLEATLPYMLLQPLVENAVRHGTSRRDGTGRVEVQVIEVVDRLSIEVRDNGAGLPEESHSYREGFGIRNTRARLATLYGSDYSLTLAARPTGGTSVLVSLPLSLGNSRDQLDPSTSAIRGAPLKDREAPPDRRAVVIAGLLIWAGVMVVWVNQAAGVSALSGRPYPLTSILRALSPTISLWLAVTAVVGVIAGRLTRNYASARTILLSHLAVGTMVIALHSVLTRFTSSYNPVGASWGVVVPDVIVYTLIAGCFHAWFLRRRATLDAKTEAAAERDLAGLNLASARLQIQPPFLLDTLADVERLARSEPERADEVIVSTAEWLRLLVAHGQQETVTLESELAVVGAYLNVVAGRTGRNGFRIEADPHTLSFRLPPLLVQARIDQLASEGADLLSLELRTRQQNGTVELQISFIDDDEPRRRKSVDMELGSWTPKPIDRDLVLEAAR